MQAAQLHQQQQAQQQMAAAAAATANANNLPPIATQCFMLSNMFDPVNESEPNWDAEIRKLFISFIDYNYLQVKLS